MWAGIVKRLALFLSVFFIFVIGFIGWTELFLPDLMSAKIAEAIHKNFNGNPAVVAKVSARPAIKMLAGNFDTVNLTIHDVKISGIVIDEVTTTLKNVRINTFSLLWQTKYTADELKTENTVIKISSKSINQYLAKENKNSISKLYFDFDEKEGILVTGNVLFFGDPLEFFLKGNLKLKSGNILRFVPRKLIIGDFEIPTIIEKKILPALYFEINFNDLPLNLTIRHVSIKNGLIILTEK